jgi:hypothetical protein
MEDLLTREVKEPREVLLDRGLKPPMYTLELEKSIRPMDSTDIWKFGPWDQEEQITLAPMSKHNIDILSNKNRFQRDYRVDYNFEGTRVTITYYNNGPKFYATLPYLPSQRVLEVDMIPGTQQAVMIRRAQFGLMTDVFKFNVSTIKDKHEELQKLCNLQITPNFIKNVVFDKSNQWMCIQAPLGSDCKEHGVSILSLAKGTEFQPIFVNDCWAEWAASMKIDHFMQFCNIGEKCYAMFRFFGTLNTAILANHIYNKPMFSFFELSQTKKKMKELIRIFPDNLQRKIFKTSLWVIRPYKVRFPTILKMQINMMSYFRRFISTKRQGLPDEIINKIQNYLVEMEWKENNCRDEYQKFRTIYDSDTDAPRFRPKKLMSIL